MIKLEISDELLKYLPQYPNQWVDFKISMKQLVVMVHACALRQEDDHELEISLDY